MVDDLSANFIHTSVSGASALGRLWGFEVGLVGGQTQTPNINRLVKTADPNSDSPHLPMAELLGVLTVPAGITAEIGLVPKVGSSEFRFNSLSLSAKWTINEVIALPLSVAVKGHLTTLSMDSEDVIDVSGTNIPVT